MRFAGLLLATAVLVAPCAAQAQGWAVSLGPGVQVAPPYEGARNMTIVPYPSGTIGRPGRAWQFMAPDDSPSLGLVSGAFRGGIAVAFRGRRNDDGSRVGLHSVAPAVEPGVFGEIWPVTWLRTRAEVRVGASGHSGWVGDLAIDAVQAAGPFTFAAGPRLGFGSESYMDKYFSVSAAEALANPNIAAAFDAEAGMRFAGFAAAVIHRPGGRWMQSIGVAYHELVGDAAGSPVVKQIGTAEQWIFNATIVYSF